MDETQKKRLKKKGWKVGTASEFLDLKPEEAAFIEVKMALVRLLKTRRKRQGLSQTELAELIGSSQSRVAKMEAGDPSVSLDLLIKAAVALGASRKDVARAIAS